MVDYEVIISKFYNINRYTLSKLLPDGFVQIKKEIFTDNNYLIKFTNFDKNKGIDSYIYLNEIEWLNYLQKYEFIPKFYETKIHKKNIYILMEYLKGKSLDNLNYLDIKFLQNHMKEFKEQLYKILDIFKNESIIHRDLRPHNIVFVKTKESFEIKVIDFQFMRKIDIDMKNPNEEHYGKVCENIGGVWRDKNVELNSYQNDKYMIDRVIEDIEKDTFIKYFYRKLKEVVKWNN